jgi:hypothetical protein
MIGDVNFGTTQFTQDLSSFHRGIERITHFEKRDAQTVDVNFLRNRFTSNSVATSLVVHTSLGATR